MSSRRVNENASRAAQGVGSRASPAHAKAPCPCGMPLTYRARARHALALIWGTNSQHGSSNALPCTCAAARKKCSSSKSGVRPARTTWLSSSRHTSSMASPRWSGREGPTCTAARNQIAGALASRSRSYRTSAVCTSSSSGSTSCAMSWAGMTKMAPSPVSLNAPGRSVDPTAQRGPAHW